jgi:hypothetical protein
VLVAKTLSSYPRSRLSVGNSVNAPTLIPKSVPLLTESVTDDEASGRSTCGVCWSRVCLAGVGVSTWAWTAVAAHDNTTQPRMGVQANRVRDARIVMGLAGHPGNGASVG